MPRHGHQLAGGVPHSPHFLQHGATRRPARAVTVAPILPRGQGAHAQWHSAPCVVAGPPLRRCRCLGSGITSELLLNSHGIAAHSIQAIQATPGPILLRPSASIFAGLCIQETRPCYSEALNLRRGGECGMEWPAGVGAPRELLSIASESSDIAEEL